MCASMTDIIRVTPDNPSRRPSPVRLNASGRADWSLFRRRRCGLGVNAFDRAAVQRLFAAKQRPSSDPLIVHVGSFESIGPLVSRVPKSARSLARQFWPGPLTLVFPRSAQNTTRSRQVFRAWLCACRHTLLHGH